jgi:hypothetical protein
MQAVVVEEAFEYTDGILHFFIGKQQHLIEHLFSFQKDGHRIDF